MEIISNVLNWIHMLEDVPLENNSIALYSVNFAGGEDCAKPLHFYQSILGGKVLKESFAHAELELNSGLRIVFSKETEHCPVRGGTLTLSPKFENQLDVLFTNCKQIMAVETKGYSLYEDPWGNWIWLYFTKN